MDVDHDGVRLPRRTMRRPVAGGIPAPSLEQQFALPILEEDYPVPNWIYFVGAGVLTSLALAFAGYAALAWWIDRWISNR